MSNYALDDFVAVPLPTQLYLAVAERHPGAVSSVIEQVVLDFLDRTDENRPYMQSFSSSSSKGHSWGPVFLPSGTQIRICHYNEYKYAEIVDDKIIYEGNTIPSISQLASLMRNNTKVNAWRHVEVKRPTDKAWVWANFIRRKG